MIKHVFLKEGEEIQDVPITKKRHKDVVAYSEQYAGITESAVQSFLSVLDSYEIENLYLQLLLRHRRRIKMTIQKRFLVQNQPQNHLRHQETAVRKIKAKKMMN